MGYWHIQMFVYTERCYVVDYDWSSNQYSSWTESRWSLDAFHVRIFLMPSFEQEVWIPLFHS